MRIVIPLVLSALLLPSVVATPPTWTLDESTVPITRDYMDPLTTLIYHYDAASNTLVPTGQLAGPGVGLYAALDVYPRGTMPNPTTTAVGHCTTDYCVATLVAFVGPRSVRILVADRPDSSLCGPAQWQLGSSPVLGSAVTFYRGGMGTNHCAPGTACAHLIIDGGIWGSDCTRY